MAASAKWMLGHHPNVPDVSQVALVFAEQG